MTYQFEADKQNIVDDERPFATIAVGRDTKDDGTNRTEHEHEGDTPRNIRVGLAKLLRETADGQGDGEEVKGVPGLFDWVYSQLNKMP